MVHCAVSQRSSPPVAPRGSAASLSGSDQGWARRSMWQDSRNQHQHLCVSLSGNRSTVTAHFGGTSVKPRMMDIRLSVFDLIWRRAWFLSSFLHTYYILHLCLQQGTEQKATCNYTFIHGAICLENYLLLLIAYCMTDRGIACFCIMLSLNREYINMWRTIIFQVPFSAPPPCPVLLYCYIRCGLVT